MLENRMVTDDFIDEDYDYDEYLEYLYEKDDERYDEEIFERLGGE